MRGLIATTVLTLVMSISVEKRVFAQQEQTGTRTVVKKVLPVYSDIARRMQLRGIVEVEVIIPPNGTVKSSRVIGGSPLLARAATEAIEMWKWAPAPGETKELVELNFHPEFAKDFVRLACQELPKWSDLKGSSRPLRPMYVDQTNAP